jgi:hypothetical protein
MSDQPERPIEKLLRECGKGRLPSQPLELHPADRRLLQDEVARIYSKTEQRSSWFGIRPLPKLAWAFCALSVVGLAVLVSMRTERQPAPSSPVALNQEAITPAPPGNAPSPQVKTETVPPTATLADSLAAPAREPEQDKTLQLQSATAQQTDVSSSVAMNAAEQQLASDVVARTEFAGAAPAKAPEPATPAAGVYRYGLAPRAAALSKQDSPTTVQNFVQEHATGQAQEDRRAQAILASFQFERSGSEVRIIDEDGSVYSGTLAPPQSQVLVRAARRDQPVANGAAGGFIPTKKPAPTASSDEFTFRVAGTNRTLQELISFDGTWSTLTNIAPVTQVTKDVSKRTQVDGKVSPAAPSAGRISGTASIQGSNAININAISQRP